MNDSVVISSLPLRPVSGVLDSQLGADRFFAEKVRRFRNSGVGCLPNLGVGLIELPIAPKLAFLGPTDAIFREPDSESCQ